ncbi:DNA alkylation repair protein [archaeon]|nr:DNA alkylation repair protein [archaeon]
MIQQIKQELQKSANLEKAKIYMRFFKTGPKQYGEGDQFLGLTMPEQRVIAKKYINISLEVLQELITSSYHEHRMTALIILTYKYKKADEDTKKEIYDFYIKNYNSINNWDLVDVTAPNIVGEYLLDRKSRKRILYEFATSDHLWKKRIAIISTFTFIRNNDFQDTINISEILLQDKHDLIHKAVGWMLREMGKKDEKQLINFLDKHYKIMPRTMLRYSLEKLSEEQRKHYMKK